MQVKAALDEFLIDCEVRSYSPKTIKSYRNRNELLIKFLDLSDVHEVEYENRCTSKIHLGNAASHVTWKMQMYSMINNKERFVAKSPYMAKVLLRYYTFHQGFFEFKQIPDPLFLPRAGKPLTVVAVERVVRMAGETAKVRKNIRCAPHTCRHYFAQCQLQNGNDVYSAFRLLGNSCNGSFSNQ